MLDRVLRKEIVQEVHKVLKKVLTEYNEVWISEADLLKTFPCFTKGWIRRYGHALPRTRAIVYDKDGRSRKSAWMYRKNLIQKYILEDKIRQIEVNCL